MKKIIILSIIILTACNKNEYRHSCGVFQDENAEAIVGKWRVSQISNNYRISDGSWDSGIVGAITGELKFCADGLGTFDSDKKKVPTTKIEWNYEDDGKIYIAETIYTDPNTQFGIFRPEYHFTVNVDEENYQHWSDTTSSVGPVSGEPVISIKEWTLEREE